MLCAAMVGRKMVTVLGIGASMVAITDEIVHHMQAK